jgi:hypothetical protein
MSKDYTTLRVTEDAKEQAQDSKTDSETWSDYIQRCTDNPPEVREFVDTDTLSVELDASERQKIAKEVAKFFQS